MYRRKLIRVCYRSSGPMFAGRSAVEPDIQAEQPAQPARSVRFTDILTALSLLAVAATITVLLLTWTTDPASTATPLSVDWYP